MSLIPFENTDLMIAHRQLEALALEISRCQQMTLLAHEPYCMSLEGPTGAGKTRLVKHYMSQYPAYETPAGLMRPVFYMMTPAETTIKGMAEQMLTQLGDPAAHKGTRTQMDFRLDHLIQHCGVQLVILDDFHHLLNIHTDRSLKAVSDWLKVRIKNTGKPFLIVGIEGELAKVLNYNPQLARLFAARTTLKPFAWDLNSKPAIAEFDLFIRQVEHWLAIQFPADLPRLTLLNCLHYATKGLVGHIVALLRYTTLLAHEQETRILDLDTLAIAFEKSLGHRFLQPENPFKQIEG
jgi:hypothetical protein